jgi:hypothetical protein
VSDDRIPRRQAFAQLVLSGDVSAILHSLHDENHLMVRVDSLAQLRRMAAEFLPGARVGHMPGELGDRTHISYADGQWQGWHLSMRAEYSIESVDPLDEQTAAQLQALADMPERVE